MSEIEKERECVVCEKRCKASLTVYGMGIRRHPFRRML